MKVVRVRGLKEYRVKGKLYRYHRLSKTRIDADLSDQALAAEVDRLDKLYAPLAAKRGSLRLLIAEYRAKSEHWSALRARTRKDYERTFKWMGAGADSALTSFKPPFIAGLRDKAKKQHGFKFANQMLVALSKVFAFGVEYGHMPSNPAKDIAPVARPSHLADANRPWSPSEAVALIEHLPVILRGPVALAAYLALREGDALALSRTAYAGDLIAFSTSKTRRALELHAVEDLRAIIDRSLRERAAYFRRMKRTDNATTLFVNSRGKPWTVDGFKTSFGKARDELVKQGLVRPGLTFHGARHGVATILADVGYDASIVKHLLGHGAETMTEHYQRRAKRRGPIKDMAEAVQRAYRNVGNVVPLARTGNENV